MSFSCRCSSRRLVGDDDGDLVEGGRERLRDRVEGEPDQLLERAVSGAGTAGPGPAAALGHGARILGAMEPCRRRMLPPSRTASSWSSGPATGSTSSTGAAPRRARRRPPHPRPVEHGLVLDAGRAPPASPPPRRRDGPARPRPVRRPDRGLRPADLRGRRDRGRPRAPGCSRPPSRGSSSPATASGRSSPPGPPSSLGERCAGLVLVDGGWESLEAASGMDVDEFLRGLDEPPEVMRSMAAFLADRAAFDPATWDADQERAARATRRRDARRQGRPVDPAARRSRPASGRCSGTTRSRPWRRSTRPDRRPRRGRRRGRARGRAALAAASDARAAAGRGRDPGARRSATTGTT